MPKNKLKFATYLLITVILTLGLSISLQSLLAAWTAPTASPPGNNIEMPINESASNQTKLGGLSIHNNFYVGDGGSNDVLYVNNAAGKVGIGTSGPTTLLSLGDDYDVNTIKLSLFDNGGTDMYGFGVSAGSLDFYSGGPASGGPKFVIDASGNVGVNDTSPDGKLEINPNGIEDDGDEFVIDATGNVGIGVNPPTQKLDVNGKVNANDYYIGVISKWASTLGGYTQGGLYGHCNVYYNGSYFCTATYPGSCSSPPYNSNSCSCPTGFTKVSTGAWKSDTNYEFIGYYTRTYYSCIKN